MRRKVLGNGYSVFLVLFMYRWSSWSGFGFGLHLACLVGFDIIGFQFQDYLWLLSLVAKSL